jgi:hypothetical protein
MKNNRLISLLAVGTIVLGFSAIGIVRYNRAQAEQTPQTTENSEQVQLLFVQNAVSGSFKDNTLTLEGIGPTIFFSDRPERVTGQVRTSEFIGHWDKGSDNFAANPPNATLSIFGKENVESAVVELTEPKLENNTLSYQVKVLEGKLPDSFEESSLFIDILGRWRMYAAGAAAGAAAASGANYYYHPPVVVAPVAPVYVAPRPVVVY